MTHELQCHECTIWLHAYLDNELDTEMALRINNHIINCVDCKLQFEGLRILHQGLISHVPYHPAPALLKQQIMSTMQRRQSNFSVKSLWIPAFSAAALAASVAFFIAVPTIQDRLVDEAVSSHVRSLMEQHLTDIASSDKHTVKPWFARKLDFAPPVVDFTEQGYPLLGGRLDYINHQNTAALSYQRNKHIINLFIQPSGQSDSSPHQNALRGFNIFSWRQNHLLFEVVSDLNSQELEAFVKMVSEQNTPLHS